MLGCMRRVEMVTYRTAGDAPCRLPGDLGEALNGSGWSWSQVLRERHAGEQSVVYQRAGTAGGLEGLLVVELEGGRLEVVHVRGRIDRLLEVAQRDGGLETSLSVLSGR